VKTNEPVASALAEISPSRTRRFSYAEKLFHEERFVESAVEFESLWLEYHNVRYLYNAALAPQRAGHLGHAAAYLSDYVKSTKTSAELRISAARSAIAMVVEAVKSAKPKNNREKLCLHLNLHR